jgi:exosortase E/protease (VPEID-CTERM system)
MVILLAALWLFRDRLRFPRAWWLLPLGALVSLVANVFRLVALVLVGAYVSPEIGQGGFHSYAGTLLFCGLSLSIVGLAVRSPAFAHVRGAGATLRARGGDDGGAVNPAAPYLVPFLAVTAAGLIARAFSSPGHEPLSALRPAVGLVALAIHLRAYRSAAWRETSRVSAYAPLAGALVGTACWALGRLGPTGAGPAAPETTSIAAAAVRLLEAGLVLPLAEELAFRGFLARRLSKADFEALAPRALSVVGIVGSSVVFGLVQARPLSGTLAGVAYALLYRARGRLADAVVAHAAANAVLLIVSIAR